MKKFIWAKGQCRWRPEGPTPRGGAPGVGPAAPHGVCAWVPSSNSPLDFVNMSGKIGAWLFVSSNSENIFLITFLKPKTTENGQLALWHIVNRLVS